MLIERVQGISLNGMEARPQCKENICNSVTVPLPSRCVRRSEAATAHSLPCHYLYPATQWHHFTT